MPNLVRLVRRPLRRVTAVAVPFRVAVVSAVVVAVLVAAVVAGNAAPANAARICRPTLLRLLRAWLVRLFRPVVLVRPFVQQNVASPQRLAIRAHLLPVALRVVLLPHMPLYQRKRKPSFLADRVYFPAVGHLPARPVRPLVPA